MIVFLIYATIAFGFEIGLLKNNLYKIIKKIFIK